MVRFHYIEDGVYYPGDHDIEVISEPDVFAPDPPATASATSGNGTVVLDWVDNDDVDFSHYKIYQSTVSGGPYTLIATGTASTFTVTGLTNGTTYYFVVTAVDDSNNESSESAEVSETPAAGVGDTTPPAAPTGLAPTAGNSQVTLNWNDNGESDLDHYLVYQGTVTGGPYTPVASPTASTYIVTGLTNGTAYYFRVTARDTSDNESAQSSEVTSTPSGAADSTAPATPTGLAASASSGQVALNWNDNTEADLAGYRVYRATSSGGTYTLIASPTLSGYTDTAVTAGTPYWYKVSALDVTGNESSQTAFVTGTPTTISGVAIAAGASIQAAVNANPNGTTFILAAGTWTNQTVVPKTGNRFIGALGSAGERLSILDGTSTTQYSIYVGTGSVSGVQIRNIIVEDYNTPLQNSALGGTGIQGGLIENCEARYNKAGGITVGGGTIVRNCFIHHNEQTGIYAKDGTGAIVEGCEISFNNYLQLYDPQWEAGGSKFLKTTNLILRNNNVHDNHGPGLWTDHQNLNTLFEGNTVKNNHGPGIFHEISYAAIIRNNHVEGNGFGYLPWLDGSGILVNSSANVEIYGNTVKNNNDGIGATHTDRSGSSGGPWEVRNLYVHDNIIIQPTGKAAGIVTSVTFPGAGSTWPIFTTWNNRFENNTYTVPNLATSRMWDWIEWERTFAQWQAYGHDDTQPPGPSTNVAPTNLSATPGNTSIALNWDDSTYPQFNHYTVYQATASGGPYTAVTDVFPSNFAVTGLTNGTAYWFKVTAVDNLGNASPQSTSATATPAAGGDTTAPAAPTTLVATAGDARVTLAWDDNVESDLAHYRIYRGTVTGGPYTLVTISPDAAHVNTGLLNGTTYYFKVSAVDTSNNESALSNEDSATPAVTGADVTPPAVPTGLGAVAGAAEIALNWADNGESDFSYYKVYKATASGGPFTLLASPTASLYTDTAVISGTAYWYKVSAVDTSNNESAQTSSVTDTPSAPSGVAIAGGANIQTTVNANSAGTTYLLGAGTFTSQQVTPKAGDTFIGTLGAGGVRQSIMNGNFNTTYAFTPNGVNDITIKNLEIKNYVTEPQYGAITARTFEGAAAGLRWTVENCYVHHNSWAGIHVSEGGIVRNNLVFANGVIGVKVYWVRTTSALVEGNEIWGNNTTGADEFWEAGGTKFAWTKDITVRNNDVHDNGGPGLWTDIDNYGTLYEGNTVEDNAGVGIFHEISYSGIIRNNVVRRNGYRNRGWLWEAGILIAASQNVEIYGNTVEDNFNGITLIQQNRGVGAQGEYLVANVNVHDNIVEGGRTGAAQEVNSNAIFTSRNNRFTNNDYTSTTFVWLGSDRTFSQWQGYGHDLTGSSS